MSFGDRGLYISFHLQEPGTIIVSDCFQTLFSNFVFKLCESLVSKKAYIFLITPGEFCSWKVYRLQDINKNVISYGNLVGNCKVCNLFLYLNGLTN